jgi:hypothetical protein
MTGAINNHPGLGDSRSAASAAGSKGQVQKGVVANESPTAVAGNVADQVSLSSAGMQLSEQRGVRSDENPLRTPEDAFALAARVKDLLVSQGELAMSAHGGGAATRLHGLLQPG